MAGTIEDRIGQLVRPLIEGMGLSLWGVRYRSGTHKAHLQIYIDSIDGVTADDCGDVTNMLSPALDAADIIAPAYILEVSSPGLDRIIFTLEQLKSIVGSTVKVSLRIPMAGQRRFEGRLAEVGDDGMFTIEDKTAGSVRIAYTNAEGVRVVPDFSNITKTKQQI